MSGDQTQALVAYLATLGAIVVLALGAAIVCVVFDGTPEELAKLVVALGFIGAAVTGLIGVLGTFRPKGPPVAATQSGDVNLTSEKVQ